MLERTVQNHSDDGTPADGECERGPGPKAAAFATWARGRAAEFDKGKHHASWLMLVNYAETLADTNPDIVFFDTRGAFVQLTDIESDVEFWTSKVPPLANRGDFLSSFGGFGFSDGPAAMAALIRAVERH